MSSICVFLLEFITLAICSKYVLSLDNHVIKTGGVIDESIAANTKENVPNEIDLTMNPDIKKAPEINYLKKLLKPNLLSSGDVPPKSYIAENVGKPNTNFEFASESGGIPSRSTAKNLDHVEAEVIDDDSPSKGSKGRKGVGKPSSSVVPRKGVDKLELEAVGGESNQSNSHTNPNVMTTSSVAAPVVSSKLNATIEEKHQTNPPTHEVTKKVIAKKPEVVSDLGDADEFDSYPIIKASTTGEDYVMIGIVIVIGIWFLVFGALIFYRRAGEYWDRRHYRRMDFLVEGMYND